MGNDRAINGIAVQIQSESGRVLRRLFPSFSEPRLEGGGECARVFEDRFAGYETGT
jgi:hypothetical protein